MSHAEPGAVLSLLLLLVSQEPPSMSQAVPAGGDDALEAGSRRHRSRERDGGDGHHDRKKDRDRWAANMARGHRAGYWLWCTMAAAVAAVVSCVFLDNVGRRGA